MGKAGRGRERKITRRDEVGSLQEHLAGREVEPRGAHIAASGSGEAHRHLPITSWNRILLDHDRIGSLGDGSAGEDAHRLAGAELAFESMARRAHADEAERRGGRGDIGCPYRITIHRRRRKGRLVSRGHEVLGERAAMGFAERHALGRQRFFGGRENSRECLGDGQKRILVHAGLHIIEITALSSSLGPICSWPDCSWPDFVFAGVVLGLVRSGKVRRRHHSHNREIGQSRPRVAMRNCAAAAISRS